jgi:Mg2+/Co2+ transporter CorB
MINIARQSVDLYAYDARVTSIYYTQNIQHITHNIDKILHTKYTIYTHKIDNILHTKYTIYYTQNIQYITHKIDNILHTK